MACACNHYRRRCNQVNNLRKTIGQRFTDAWDSWPNKVWRMTAEVLRIAGGTKCLGRPIFHGVPCFEAKNTKMISFQHAMNSPIEVATFWKIQFIHEWLAKQINNGPNDLLRSASKMFIYIVVFLGKLGSGQRADNL